ncbi:MAG: glycosyltransferase family 4 protein, partial [bacterium]|nr:glycosyltransferase family 4 protein [bacterium]
MKILFVCPYLPYPVISGGHTRVFNLIKHLSRRHQISFLGYNREPVTDEQRQVLQRYCARLRFIHRPPIWTPANLLRYLISHDPLMHVINGRNSLVTKAIDEEIESFKPDLVHVEHYHMAECVLKAERVRDVPKVISEQGVEYLILERMAQVCRHPIKKLAAAAEAARIKPFEVAICNRFDACIEVSQDDKMIIERAGVKAPVRVAINGVDTEYFTPDPKTFSEPAIVFVGTFKFFGNNDAVRWLLKQVWPLIKKQSPQAKFYIVGNKPPSWLQKFNDPNVIVTGWVPDVREYINKSQIMAAPLRMGSGTKLKILEAMSMA